MKNPWMSLFLSQANRIGNTVRGQAIAAGKREATKNSRLVGNAWVDAILGPWGKPPRTRRKKK